MGWYFIIATEQSGLIYAIVNYFPGRVVKPSLPWSTLVIIRTSIRSFLASLLRTPKLSIDVKKYQHQPSLKLIQILSLLKNEALATENVEVTDLGSETMNELIASLFLECRRKIRFNR
jgi:hypothetical protein